MAVNILEIDYIQLCFSDLDESYCLEKNNEDVILYQNQIFVDKLRISYLNPQALENNWDSFKLKITDGELQKEIKMQCLKLNFNVASKIKVVCKLKLLGKMITRCIASIAQNIDNNQITFEINVMNKLN